MSMGAWLVYELRKADGRKRSDPRPSPAKGKLAVSERVNAQSAMRLHIRTFAIRCHARGSNSHPRPMRPRTLSNLQNTKRLSRSFRIFTDVADLADLAYSPISPIFGEVGEVGGDSRQSHRFFTDIGEIGGGGGILTDLADFALFSVRSVRILADSHRPRRSHRTSANKVRTVRILGNSHRSRRPPPEFRRDRRESVRTLADLTENGRGR